MGVATGCSCKEVYRFPHTTYPYSSCICSFLQQHPYFVFIKKKFFCSFLRDVLISAGSKTYSPRRFSSTLYFFISVYASC